MSSSIELRGLSSSCARFGVAETNQQTHASNAIRIKRIGNDRLFKETSAIGRKPFCAQPSSWFRVRRLVCVAARGLPGGKLHDFHARSIGVERVDAVLAVATDLGPI